MSRVDDPQADTDGRVLVVGDGADEGAAALSAAGWTATHLSPSDDAAASVETDPLACVVVHGLGALTPALEAAATGNAVPVVVVTDRPASAVVDNAAVAGHVRPGSPERLVDAVEWVVGRESRHRLRVVRDRIADLHDATAKLAGVSDADELFERTVETADRILDFEVCYVGRVDGDEVVPVAVSDGAPEAGVQRMRVDEGVVGRTLETGESQLVRQVSSSTDAVPAREDYRSGLSVPIGDAVVFQAVSHRDEAFDETDLELAELLAAHVAATFDRIEAETGLRAERDRLDALFGNIPDAAVAFEFRDGVPVATRVNNAFERTFGYSSGEVVGESVDEFIVPGDRDERAIDYNRSLQAGENVRTEVRRLTADGPRDFLLYVVPLALGEANVAGYAIYSDLTELKERERELRRQNERLDEFASVVSHDLRNPLTVADGYLELARAERDDPDLDRVASALDRMAELIEGLLVLARHGRVVGETEPVSLRDTARRAWASVDTANATLTVVDGAGTVEADDDRLVELLENLFRNAMEHGETDATEPDDATDGDGSDAGNVAGDGGDDAGSAGNSGNAGNAHADDGEGDTGSGGNTHGERTPSIRVEVGPLAGGGFYVADDGPGIPDDQRARVFETGYTTAEGGSGLGLAIVRRIAEAHGWTPSATASAVGGARFEFAIGADE